MAIVIEDVVSTFRAKGGDLPPRTMEMIVGAVLEALDAEHRRGRDRAEELSLENYQSRAMPGR